MNPRAFGPANVSAGALVIGGAIVVFWPSYAVTAVQLVLVTAAASVAVYALASNVPSAGWISPFKWLSPFAAAAHPGRLEHRSGELDFIRDRFADRRQDLGEGVALPPAVLRRLKPLIAAALDADARSPRGTPPESRLSAAARAIHECHPHKRPKHRNTIRPDERGVAKLVEDILNELDQLGGRAELSRRPTPSLPTRTV